MTSRTPIGAQQRPPQRASNTSQIPSQRPPTQRTLSTQYLPSSPARKDSFTDPSAASDSPDAPQNRHVTSTPRRAGSKLRLELSNDAGSNLSIPVDSPSSLGSARFAPADVLDGANSPALSRASHQDFDNPPLPMPKRRQPTIQRISTPREQASAASIAKKDARPKPYTVQVPTAAPRLASTTARSDGMSGELFGKGLFSGRADFYPWSGSHREDDWSTESITKGIWEKPTSTESSSARLAIFPALKPKQSLAALSTIFMNVLHQRRQRGQITAPSTFKPPPRVTLTDTKREVWLKDLANPATPLRRLSRTIPHGIRGRALLDQCLNKSVPTERAVWLAKCVGANEIRANKRKSVNGAVVLGSEFKWCRDWTIFVEQFVDSVVSSVIDDGWKSRVTYATRLATSLYSEQLLDRDHYLEWIISGLENSQQGRLPMWILIARIYWADLLRMRKYGRRLVFALLSHMHTIHNDPDRDILDQLSSQLNFLLGSLIKSNSESFLCPSAWSKYRDALKTNLPADDDAALVAYNIINARNSRLAVTGTGYTFTGRQHFVRLLDSTFQTPIGPNFADQCWATSEDKTQLAKTLVEWATSHHRPGLSRVYVAASLLKSWCSIPNFEATPSILEMLDGVASDNQTRKSLVYHLVTELVRNRNFAVIQYLQWLIARGGYQGASDIDPDNGACATRLLIEMPVYCFQEKWKNERGNLLRRAGNYSISDEELDISNALKCMEHTLGLPLPPHEALSQRKPMPLRKLSTRIRKSSRALKSSIGAHLRDVMARQALENGISSTFFMSARSIMETTEDFTMLLDMVKTCTKTSAPEVLAACADTINSNLHVFLPLGSAAEVFNVLLSRLKALSQQQGMIVRPLLAAISHLANRLPGNERIATQLRQELLQSDRSNAIDACSPVSDSMMPQTQGPDGEVSEEIDKLLATGNRIDHPTMNRLFRTIVPKLEAGWAKLDDSRRVFASLLTKMRVFDTQHFDKLMADWVSHVRSLEARPALTDVFPILITAGCLTVSILLHTANASPPTPNKSIASLAQASATYFQELLYLLLMTVPKSKALTPEEAYHFTIHQQSAKSDNLKGMLALIRNVVLEYSILRDFSNEAVVLLDDPLFQDKVSEMLRLLVVVDAAAASEALSIKTLPSKATDFISKLATNLLIPDEEGKTPPSFDHILRLANELTLPFCQLKLNFDLSLTEISSGEGDEPSQSRFELFANAMDRAIEANNIMWTRMLPCLSSDISHHLKTLAYRRFLGLIPSLKSDKLSEATSVDQIHIAENLLGVIEAITAGQSPAKSSHLTASLVDKLSDIWDIVALKNENNKELQQAVLNHWLPALLRLLTLHGSPSEPFVAPLPVVSAGGKAPVALSYEVRARIILVLGSLILELQSLPPNTAGAILQQVFDVAIVLVDALPDDIRLHCAKTMLLLPGSMASTSLTSDPRLYYLFSTPQPTAADNLVLAHKDKPGMLLHNGSPRNMGIMLGIGPFPAPQKYTPFVMRRWELLSESTPNIGENDTSLSLGLFEAIKIQ